MVAESFMPGASVSKVAQRHVRKRLTLPSHDDERSPMEFGAQSLALVHLAFPHRLHCARERLVHRHAAVIPILK